MQEREVEVMVAFQDKTWEAVWVGVQEDASQPADYDSLKEKAEEATRELMERAGRKDVSLIYTIYVSPPAEAFDPF
jgi:predicted RNA-binding protein with PUA-like domain